MASLIKSQSEQCLIYEHFMVFVDTFVLASLFVTGINLILVPSYDPAGGGDNHGDYRTTKDYKNSYSIP